METQVWLGLGSNIGNSKEIIFGAFKRISDILTSTKLSSLYVTSPLIVLDQPNFLNAVVTGFTYEEPLNLLAEIHEIEKEFGRNRSVERQKGERSLDIDILLLGDKIISLPDLIVPHIALKSRRFVLVPLLELSPDLIDPETGVLFSQFESKLTNQGICTKLELV